jgi:beta-galactosidase
MIPSLTRFTPYALRFAQTRLFAGLILLGLAVVARAGELYVGTNYHPHDSNPETWTRDIALMQQAGFRVVRLGHLAWDSYEPKNGEFNFAWFDQVMDKLNAAGIKAVVDIAVRPAPIWLHHQHPSVSVTDVNGVIQYPNHRYFEDVGDPVYQQFALRFADALVRRYAKHPALLAFGIDNEPGDGQISYSAGARARFIAWLRAKYRNVENLNKAWAGQRWSRRIGDFEEVGFPVTAVGFDGPPERVLDFRRFVSDEVGSFFSQVLDHVNAGAPGVLTTTNMWYFSPRKYFDYAPIAYSGKLSRCGDGFYPGVSLKSNLDDALFGMARVQFENTTPFWCTEFVSATAVPGAMRRAAYASLMLGNQLVCCWTWQSMHGGEEQYLEGLIDWDGQPSRKYFEYQAIATELKKIERYGFPYQPRAEVALAFSFPSQIASGSFPEPHDGQVMTAFSYFNKRNVDVRVVDVTRSKLPYKLLVLPGVALMDDASATQIRAFVEKGGTVVMTGYSGMVDETGQVFATTHPGRLSDVFGIRVGSYEESEGMNELSKIGTTGQHLRVNYSGRDLSCESPRFDAIDLKGADVLGRIVGLDRDYPIITRHRFGAGTAIYVGLPARSEVLGAVLGDLIAQLGIATGPAVPEGVMARQIDSKHILYLNLDGGAKHVDLPGHSRSILREQDYSDGFTLEAYQPDFVETP